MSMKHGRARGSMGDFRLVKTGGGPRNGARGRQCSMITHQEASYTIIRSASSNNKTEKGLCSSASELSGAGVPRRFYEMQTYPVPCEIVKMSSVE